MYDILWSEMTLSGIISTKTSKSPWKSGGGPWPGNKVSQNTVKNTPEDDLDTFCDMINPLTSKHRPGFLGLKIARRDRSGL